MRVEEKQGDYEDRGEGMETFTHIVVCAAGGETRQEEAEEQEQQEEEEEEPANFIAFLLELRQVSVFAVLPEMGARFSGINF